VTYAKNAKPPNCKKKLNVLIYRPQSQTWPNLSDSTFSAAEPRVWHYLPTNLRQPDLS